MVASCFGPGHEPQGIWEPEQSGLGSTFARSTALCPPKDVEMPTEELDMELQSSFQSYSIIFTHLHSSSINSVYCLLSVYSVSTQRLLSVCSVSTQCLPRAYSVSTVIKRSLCHCLLRDPWYASMQKSYCNQIQNERAHDSLIFTVESWASGLAP